MVGKINCKYNDNGAWCNNKKIKRTLFGIGARCCVEYNCSKKCEYKESYPRPDYIPIGNKKS